MKKITKEALALDLTGYTDYVDRKIEFIDQIIAGAPTIAEINPIMGVRAGDWVEMPVFNTSVNWQTGNCVNTPTGATTVIKPRLTKIVRLTDREEICLDEFDRVLPMIQKESARNTELPISEMYLNAKVRLNAYWLEKAFYQGDTDLLSGNLSKIDGILKKADSETADLAYYTTFDSFDPSEAEAFIDSLLANRNEIMREMDNLIIKMDQGKFDILSNALLSKYGIAGTGIYTDFAAMNQVGMNKFRYKQTNVMVESTHGLNGNGSIIISDVIDNFKYFTSDAKDQYDVQLEYSSYHKRMVSDLVFAMGFDYRRPETVIYAKFVPAVS